MIEKKKCEWRTKSAGTEKRKAEGKRKYSRIEREKADKEKIKEFTRRRKEMQAERSTGLLFFCTYIFYEQRYLMRLKENS